MILAPDFAAGLWDVESGADYHADRTCDSHSTLEVFRESVPLYHGTYVLEVLQSRAPTPAMVLGSAVDCWTLERSSWDRLYAVCPDVDRRTAAGKAAWSEFQASAEGKTVLTADQMAQVRFVADGICQNSLAVELLESAGKNQQAVRWRDGATGLGLKARFDRLLDCGIVLDLKTASEPAPEVWARRAYDWGYHRQAALYLWGLAEAVYRQGGAPYRRPKDLQFLHVVVGTSPPYECSVCELDDEAIELGYRQVRETIDALAACHASQSWGSRWGSKVNRVSLPRWAFNT